MFVNNFLIICNFPGAFLVPYLFFLLTIGIPLLLLEFSVGQFTSGAVGFWMFCPLFQGIQLLSFLRMFVVMTFYIVMLSWAALYLSYALLPEIPWIECERPWASNCKNSAKNRVIS